MPFGTAGAYGAPAMPPQPSRPEDRVEGVGKLFRWLLALALVALIGWGLVLAAATRGASSDSDSDIEAVVGDSCSYDRRFDPGRTHVAGPTYTVDPPSGGPHATTPASGGFKEPAAVPTDGELVHAQEHGAVVIWYRSLDEATAAGLRRLADKDRAVIVVPRPRLAVPLAATAWHRRLLCDRADIAAIERFTKAFRGRGPERVGL